MTRPHLTFGAEDFGTAVIDATEKLFVAKPWRGDPEQSFNEWLSEISNVFSVDKPDLRFGDGQFGYATGGEGDRVIVLGRPSIATLFVAMGDFLARSGCYPGIDTNARHFGMHWGYSLFYTVRPVMFRRRVREGRIHGLTAKDTYTTQTWSQLTSLGLTNGNFLVDPHFDIRTLEEQDDLINPAEVAEAEDAAELAPVVPLRPTIDLDLQDITDQMLAFTITELRRASRGRISGGYNMAKPDLVSALLDAGVTPAAVRAAQ